MNRFGMEAQVSAAINRGTSDNTLIPGAIRRAVAMLEENNNFHYMHGIRPFPKDPAGAGALAVPTLELGVLGAKAVKMLRYGLPGEQGSIAYHEILQVDYDNVVAMPANQLPEFWYPNFAQGPSGGEPQHLIVLGTAALPQAVTFEIEGFWYTDYDALPVAPDAPANWLLSKGETVVQAMALVELAPLIRQPEAAPAWQALAAVGLKTLLIADEELFGGARLESIHVGE